MIITPEPGRQKDIGKALLALTDNPADVRWVTWPTAGYQVSTDLYQLFTASQEPAEETAPAEEPPKRRRGRPRKEKPEADADGEDNDDTPDTEEGE